MALDKPENTPCEHECDDGCGIYERRPSDCSGWFCVWMWDNKYKKPDRLLADTDRPDTIGVMFDVNKRHKLVAYELRHGAFDEQHDLLTRLMECQWVAMVPVCG